MPVVAQNVDVNTAGILPLFEAHYLVNDSNISNAIGDYDDTTSGVPFYYQPDNGTIDRVGRLLITIGDQGITSADDYGAISALTNGLEFWVRERGIERRIDGNRHTDVENTDIKSNGEFHRIAFDVDDSNSLGQGTDYISVRWTFGKSGKGIFLSPLRPLRSWRNVLRLPSSSFCMTSFAWSLYPMYVLLTLS